MFKAKNTMEISLRALPLTSDFWVVDFMNGLGKTGPGRDVSMGENLLKEASLAGRLRVQRSKSITAHAPRPATGRLVE